MDYTRKTLGMVLHRRCNNGAHSKQKTFWRLGARRGVLAATERCARGPIGCPSRGRVCVETKSSAALTQIHAPSPIPFSLLIPRSSPLAGTFKILRGQDECGIEDDLGAGDV